MIRLLFGLFLKEFLMKKLGKTMYKDNHLIALLNMNNNEQPQEAQESSQSTSSSVVCMTGIFLLDLKLVYKQLQKY